MRTVATIDIGTNTTLLLVARTEPAVEVIEERAEITRLGRGIGGDGALGSEGIERTLAVLRTYAEVARRHHATIAAVGTEALRRAPNADDFLGPASAILGTPIEVIDGAREATLTFEAVAASFPDAVAGRLVVVDIGGGSTEIVIAHGGNVQFHTSLPLGSVRLTERFIRHDPATAGEVSAIEQTVDETIAGVPFGAPSPEPPTLVGVAGTVTSLAAMTQALESYDPVRVHGFVLSRDRLGREIARLRAATQEQREQIVGLDPRRADVILAGASILGRIARAAGVTDIRVSDRGIRWGLLAELMTWNPQRVPDLPR